jgi:hypothetical protein
MTFRMSRMGVVGGLILPATLVVVVGFRVVSPAARGSDGVPAFKVLAATYLDESWAPTSKTAGGYETIIDLAADPSLYRTAWMLSLAGELGIRPNAISTDESAAWLRHVLANPTRSSELPALETVALAASALVAVDAPAARADLSRAVDAWRVGTRYRWDKTYEPDWSATARAVTVLRTSGAEIPGEVTAAIAAALPTMTESSPTTIDSRNDLVAIWQAASVTMPASERAPYLPALRKSLEVALADMAPIGDSGTLATAYQIEAVAKANSLVLQLPPLRLGDPSSAGFVAIMPGEDRADDAQLTFDAIKLGWPSSPQLILSAERSSGRRGWLTTGGHADPESTYYGLQIGRSLGLRDREPAIAEQTKLWLSQPEDPMVIDASTLRRLFFVVALAHDLGLGTSEALSRSIGTRLGSTPVTDPAFPSLVELAGALRIPVPSLPDVVRGQVDPGVGLPRLFSLWQVAGADGSRRLATLIEQSRRSDGSCGISSSTTLVDLLSTAVCARVLGPSHADRVATSFADDQGYWYMRGGPSSGNAVSLRSMYLGFYLAGSVDDAGGVVY